MVKERTKDEQRVNLPWSDVLAMVIAMIQVILPALIGMVVFIIIIGLGFSLILN